MSTAPPGFYKLPFMQLQMKKVDSLNLEKPLKKFLEKQYGQHVAGEYGNAITNIQQKRSEMKNLQERSEGSKSQCLKYAADLVHLNHHFPINSGSQRINLSFGWYDSFAKRKVTQGNLYYELANTVFVAAVLSCQLGCAEARTNKSSFMVAAKQFQHAASLFQYVKEEICPKIVERIPVDITAESLECLSTLMLAYAQQCIVERAAFSKMKPENIAKLSAELGFMYESVLAQMKSTQISGNFDRNWVGDIEFKANFYNALAQYALSKKMNSDDEKGKELARLYYCMNLLDAAKGCRIAAQVKPVLSEMRSDVKSAIKAGERENAKVYHDRIPQEEDLEKIGRTKLVKLAKIDSLTDGQGEDPFSNLNPVPVMDAQQKFKEQLSLKLNAKFKGAREHRDIVKTRLSQMGLPGSIMASDAHPGFPQKVHQQIANINKQGGYDRLVNLRTTLKEMASETRSQCDKIGSLIQAEEQEDATCRSQYQQRWTRKPSPQLTINLKAQVHDFTKKVDMASNSDKVVDQKMAEYEQEFRRFELPRTALDNLMPRPVQQSQSQSGVVDQLQQSLSQLDQLLGREGDLERDLTTQRDKNTEKVKQHLMANQDNLKKAVSDLISGYEKELHEFNVLANKEDDLMKQITVQNQKFLQTKTNNTATKAREEAIQRMYAALNKYEEILANMKEGIHFYSSMQEFLKQLKERVESFVFARKIEKEDMLVYIQQAMGGVQMGGVNPYTNQPMNPQFNPFQQGRQQPPQQQGQRPPQNYQQQQYQYNYPPHGR